MAERIADEALVVRGGRNQPEDLRRGTQTHPSGVTGTSVECAEVGVTTVGAIRLAGGDVVRTSGRGPHHTTVVGLSPEVASRLLCPVIPKPAKQP